MDVQETPVDVQGTPVEVQQMVTKVLIDEISRLSEAMQKRMEAADRFIAVAGPLTGVGLTLGLAQNQPLILIVLPVAIALIFIFVLQIYTDASVHIGHRQGLEEVVNRRVGQPVLIGQSVVAAKHPRRGSVPLSSILIGSIWLVAVALGWTMIAKVVSPEMWLGAVIGYSALIVLSVATMILALGENRRAQSAAHSAAVGAYSGPIPQTPGA